MKELKIEMNIPIESIEEILITAMEGGSNYWYIMDGEQEQHCISWLSEEIKAGRLERNDKIHYKWMDAMFQGCPHKISIYDVEEANEDGDGDSADVLFQLMVMGEVAYG